MVKLRGIMAANAGASWPTVTIVGKTLTVELEALRFATIARFVAQWHCLPLIPNELGMGALETRMGVVFHIHVTRLDLDGLRE